MKIVLGLSDHVLSQPITSNSVVKNVFLSSEVGSASIGVEWFSAYSGMPRQVVPLMRLTFTGGPATLDYTANFRPIAILTTFVIPKYVYSYLTDLVLVEFKAVHKLYKQTT